MHVLKSIIPMCNTRGGQQWTWSPFISVHSQNAAHFWLIFFQIFSSLTWVNVVHIFSNFFVYERWLSWLILSVNSQAKLPISAIIRRIFFLFLLIGKIRFFFSPFPFFSTFFTALLVEVSEPEWTWLIFLSWRNFTNVSEWMSLTFLVNEREWSWLTKNVNLPISVHVSYS